MNTDIGVFSSTSAPTWYGHQPLLEAAIVPPYSSRQENALRLYLQMLNEAELSAYCSLGRTC